MRTRVVFSVAMSALTLAVGACGGGDKKPKSGTTTLGAARPAPVEIGRNVVRVPGLSPGDVASTAVLASYDGAAGAKPPGGWVLVPSDSWHDAVLSAQFAAKPISAGVLAIKRDYIPSGPIDVLARIKTTGFPKAAGLKALVLGKVGDDVYVDLQDLNLKLTNLKGEPGKLAATLVPFRGGWAHKYSDIMVVVSADARDYALPAAAWSAYSGDSIAFVHRDKIPKSTVGLLVQRQALRLQKPTIYVIGPKAVVSDGVVAQLSQYGQVKRIAGRDAVETSVALARYHDPKTGFGWGIKHGPANVSIVDLRKWQDAVGAFAFAATGPQAPMLLTDQASGLPAAVVGYLKQLRAPQPNQAYVFGDDKTPDSATVGALDRMLEPAKP